MCGGCGGQVLLFLEPTQDGGAGQADADGIPATNASSASIKHNGGGLGERAVRKRLHPNFGSTPSGAAVSGHLVRGTDRVDELSGVENIRGLLYDTHCHAGASVQAARESARCASGLAVGMRSFKQNNNIFLY